MNKSNKTAEVLKFVAKKKLVDLDAVAADKKLTELYKNSNTTTAKRRIIDTCSLLSKKGYLSVGNVDNQKVYKITDKGLRHLASTSLPQIDTDKSIWNGRWYLVCFEIAESKKPARNQLILLLKRNGFKRYSKGVWLIPYNPLLFIDGIKSQLDLKQEIKLIVAHYIDKENQQKRYFGI